MKTNSPIVKIRHELNTNDISLVYLRCINWMKKNEIKIIENIKPTFIKGFHEVRKAGTVYDSVLDWEKYIEVNLENDEGKTKITISIDSPRIIDGEKTTNRKLVWPKLAGDLLIYCGASMDELGPYYKAANEGYRHKIDTNFGAASLILFFVVMWFFNDIRINGGSLNSQNIGLAILGFILSLLVYYNKRRT